jgi:acetyltransferase-like isoleucine patch superfamily enzyme
MKFFNLLKPSIFLFYIKQLYLIKKYKNRLFLKRYRLTYERLVNIHIADHAMVCLGSKIHIRKGVDIEAYDSSTIAIGDNVWIGSRVLIGMGVTIGNNVVIGANTVLTKSVPSDSIVYSYPILIIKPLQKI